MLNPEAWQLSVPLAQTEALRVDAQIPAVVGRGQRLSEFVKQIPWVCRVENERGLNIKTKDSKGLRHTP